MKVYPCRAMSLEDDFYINLLDMVSILEKDKMPEENAIYDIYRGFIACLKSLCEGVANAKKDIESKLGEMAKLAKRVLCQNGDVLVHIYLDDGIYVRLSDVCDMIEDRKKHVSEELTDALQKLSDRVKSFYEDNDDKSYQWN